MRILITGGSGFLGSHYADAFVDRGDEVTVFDCSPQIHEFRARYIDGDLTDRMAVDHAMNGIELVIHAGGLLGTHETVLTACETVSTNMIGGLNVLEAARRHNCIVINISKPNVWLNSYSITKDSMEKFCFMYINEFNSRIAVVKLFNVYGSRQKYHRVHKAIPTWIVNALKGKPLEIFGQGTASMDLVHTRDVVDATVAIVEHFEECRIKKTPEVSQNVWSNFPTFNKQVLEIGSGYGTTVNGTIEVLKQLLNSPIEVRRLPMRRGEIDGTQLCANISRLAALTGYRPKVPLREGLLETITYYKENLSLVEKGKL